MQALVRDARPADLDLLTAFNAALAEETEGRRLDGARLRAGVAAVLQDPSRGQYRVAELDGRVVGTLLLTLEWSDWRNGWFWWIQSVYVLPQARRRGVYSALHADVLARAAAAGDVVGVRLYVEHENTGAQRTYERLGMQRSRYVFYEVGVPAPGG
jgi:ribosomal protein S18 acetylase RimI-like enzyme